MARTPNDLTDDEIEECFEGSSSVDLVREILDRTDVYDADNEPPVDEENFAEWFAYGIQGFIDAEEDSEEWQEAWDNNYEWGMNIASNINDLLTEGNE
jgi:hypothetical protein